MSQGLSQNGVYGLYGFQLLHDAFVSCSSIDRFDHAGVCMAHQNSHNRGRQSAYLELGSVSGCLPDISSTTIEKALGEPMKNDTIIHIGMGRRTSYVSNHE